MKSVNALVLGSVLCLFSLPAQSEAEKTTRLQLATFAGGCFWCMEAAFDEVEGVYSTTSVYAGGDTEDITYEQASDGIAGHAEAVVILFDPDIVGYRQLLDIYWHNIDPSVQNRQFCDEGRQYRTIIFHHNAQQQQLAQAYKQQLLDEKKFQTIYTEIIPAGKFYKAQTRHQNYHQRNPLRYQYYRYTCGRDQRLNEIWGKARQKKGHSN